MGTDCPEDFDTVKDNLLRTTVFDNDLEKFHGHGRILPPLLKAYKRHRPQQYAQRVSLLSASQEAVQSDRDDVSTEIVPVDKEIRL